MEQQFYPYPAKIILPCFPHYPFVILPGKKLALSLHDLQEIYSPIEVFRWSQPDWLVQSNKK
jgi:hypothetical protein